MEGINLNNYQSYFLDFAEGNLSAADSVKLAAFLKKNPNLQKELDEFDLIKLKDEELTENKKLKQELIRDEATGLKTADYLMIAEAEGHISFDEKEELSILISQKPQLLDELTIYHKLKLVQDDSVKYEEKQSLKQKEKRSLIWLPISAAAAAIALFIVFNHVSTQREYSPKKLSLITYENSDSTEKIKSNYNIEKAKKSSIKFRESSQSLAELPRKQKTVEAEAKVYAIPPMETLSFQNLKSIEITKELKYPFVEQLAKNPIQKNTSTTKHFQTIDRFAVNTLKSKLLKNKSVSDLLLDEIASLSNEKITYQEEAISNNDSRRFTINIGKFGYSNF